MTGLDQYYRAYTEYMQAVAPLRSHQEYEKTLRNTDSGRDSHSGCINYCVIDPEWLEQIEKALPALDIAIRENRRFIARTEEIVPIEKSRKITNESVRHLAQHTSMIAKVEGDAVTPESILNVYNEENFAIYENRFLRTLLDNAIFFVDRRCKAITGCADTFSADLKMEREFCFEQENTHFRLEYASETLEQKKTDVNADVSTLSGVERVLRIRKILTEFSSLPLMIELQKAERIRPPVTRTNVILKDPSFRAAMDLWTFLESYHKEGYQVVRSDAAGPMEEAVRQGLYDAMDFLRFSVRLKLNPPLQELLQENYETEQQKRDGEKKRLEAENQRREKLRLDRAVEQERKKQEAEKEELIRNHETAAAMREAELLRKLELQTEEFEAGLLRRKEQFEEQLAAQQKAFEDKSAEQQRIFEAELGRRMTEEHRRLEKAEAEADRLRSDFKTAEYQAAQERKAQEALRNQLHQKAAKLQQQLKNTELRYEKKLKQQEFWSEHRIAVLEKKLKKALSKCPYEEVQAVS